MTTVRTTRRILNGLAAACVVGVVAVGMWMMSEPSLPEPAEPRLRKSVQANGSNLIDEIDDSDLAAAWNRKLQGPLEDPKPMVTKRPTQPKKPRNTPRPVSAPRVELLATILDPSTKIAILQDVRGLTDQKTVGETLSLLPNGMRIESIESDHVKLQHRGRSFRIPLKSNGPAPAFQSRRNPGRRNSERERIESGEAPDMSQEEPPFVGDPGVRRK